MEYEELRGKIEDIILQEPVHTKGQFSQSQVVANKDSIINNNNMNNNMSSIK